MKELWKEIDGYGGDYLVSSFGKVKRKLLKVMILMF